MKSSPHILHARYIGYTKNTENHGDESLTWIIRDLLSPEIEVSCDGDEYDIALLGGGTLINQSPWLIDVFESALERAGRGVVLGTGVGDLTFWGNHFDRWTPLLNKCDFVGVRGPDSVDLLHQHGVSKAICVGDPYIWLHCPVKRTPIFKRMGVNLGSTNDSLWGTNDKDLHDFLVEVLRELKANGWSFVWISVWSKDLPLINAVRKKIEGDSGLLLDVRSQTLEALSSLAGCELFMGEKLHANAMAAVAGVPFISLEYQPKVRDFAKSLDMSSWVVSTAERNPHVLIELVQNLRNQRKAEAQKLFFARNKLRTDLDMFVRAIKDFYTNKQ